MQSQSPISLPLLHDPAGVGRLIWIGLAPHPKADIQVTEQVEARIGTGLVGDHHCERKPGGKRQVTLIQAEHLPVIAALCRRGEVDPKLTRRNLVVSAINLQALKNRRFRVGTVLLEGTGDCEPCERMNENLGRFGHFSMEGHGGITATVLVPGQIKLGDAVEVVTS